MKRLIVVSVLAMGTAFVGADGPGDVSEADLLAVGGLRHSAVELLHSPASTPGRAGRIVTLFRSADAITTQGEVISARILADICAVQGDAHGAAKATRLCLDATPGDHATGKRYIELSLATMQTAEARSEFLEAILAGKSYPDALKAVAAGQLVTLRIGQGRGEEAGVLFKKMQGLDRHCSSMVELIQTDEISATLSASDRLEIYLQIFKCSCWRYDLIWDSAAICGELGLHSEAVELLELYRKGRGGFAYERKAPSVDALPELPAYCNALLDAQKAEEVVKLLTDTENSRRFEPADIRPPLVEAHLAMGRLDKARVLIEKWEKSLKSRLLEKKSSPALDGEIAWFYLTVGNQNEAGLNFAKSAIAQASDDKIIMRIHAIAMLRSGLADKAIPVLEKLQDSDQYAAAYLGEYYLSQGNKEKAAVSIAAGGALGRSGPAGRKLLQVAKLAGIKLPEVKGSAKARQVLDGIRNSMQIALDPSKAINITLKPVKPVLAAGEPVLVEVVITNISTQKLALGAGFIQPAVSMTVTAGSEVFANLPIASLPAPAYLEPKKSTSVTVRLDVAKLAWLLHKNPLDEFALKVEATAGAPRGKKLDQQAIEIEPIVITRKPLVTLKPDAILTDWGNAYTKMIDTITKSLSEGDRPGRLLAGRQSASLMVMLRQAEMGKKKLPKGFGLIYKREDLLTLCKKSLRDRSPVIRSETLRALAFIKLDESLLKLITPAFRDSSWLVRMRAVELIGLSEAKGSKTVIDFFTRDSQQYVKNMAKAFSKRE